MSFTTDIKRELCRSFPKTRGALLSLLSAALTAGGERDEGGFSFTSENEAVAAYLLGAVERLFGKQMTLTGAVKDPKHGRDKFTFSLTGEGASACAEEIFSHVAEGEESALAALKGAFLGSGSCTLPRGGKTGYHLEIVFPSKESAEGYVGLLDYFQLFGSIVGRGDKFVVYCKSREGIADFLSVIGASSALKVLGEISAAREESNNRNRLENCTAGNVDRSLTASAEQVRFFMAHRGQISSLPPRLQETALARIENPTLSLAELARLTDLTKSGLSHRLRRICSLLDAKE